MKQLWKTYRLSEVNKTNATNCMCDHERCHFIILIWSLRKAITVLQSPLFSWTRSLFIHQWLRWIWDP